MLAISIFHIVLFLHPDKYCYLLNTSQWRWQLVIILELSSTVGTVLIRALFVYQREFPTWQLPPWCYDILERLCCTDSSIMSCPSPTCIPSWYFLYTTWIPTAHCRIENTYPIVLNFIIYIPHRPLFCYILVAHLLLLKFWILPRYIYHIWEYAIFSCASLSVDMQQSTLLKWSLTDHLFLLWVSFYYAISLEIHSSSEINYSCNFP